MLVTPDLGLKHYLAEPPYNIPKYQIPGIKIFVL
jgi:hypothetical protein